MSWLGEVRPVSSEMAHENSVKTRSRRLGQHLPDNYFQSIPYRIGSLHSEGPFELPCLRISVNCGMRPRMHSWAGPSKCGKCHHNPGGQALSM